MLQKHPKGVGLLLSICKRRNEMLKNYIRRYWELYTETNDRSKEFVMVGYKLGLTLGEKCRMI